jgi:3-hydroxybutyryl-CoA dehydrogenase
MMDPPMIGVVGLGTMGLGIAQVYAQAGFAVLATDAHAVVRAAAKTRLSDTLAERVAAGKLSADAREATMAKLAIVDDLEAMAPAGLVIEAIVETLEAKRILFAALEKIVSPDAVLASNTSSLSIAAIAEGLSVPSRVLGLHFFNPAPVMKLVELVAHAGTGSSSLALARSVTEAAGRTVIACGDRPGFIVNRCARPFYGEALAMLEEGRKPADVDAAMVAAGYRLGPFGLIDLVGADINLAATRELCAAMGGHPRYHVFDALVAQVEKGELGRKTGKGFVFPAAAVQAPSDAQAIALRIEATLANEAASLLAEGSVDEAGIDTALKLGLNFPRGPFQSLRAHGLGLIKTTLAELEDKAPPHLKGRYILSPELEAMA